MLKNFLNISCILLAPFLWGQTAAIVTSPDKDFKVTVALIDSMPVYTVKLNGEIFLEESPLGLQTSIGDFSTGLTFEHSEVKAVSKSYTLSKAKVSHVDYLANELIANYTNLNQDTLS
ncbi:MAG: glycoside hydrolase family 97 N-terminal domain-containing protein, partial [Leeuwenhoekiella sp.]|nr:glycoside hydrolase family 97 N-terminal domain-containing protein [Leeuwenhoekiella sp.]